MNCPTCGAEIEENQVFCNYCGKRILKNTNTGVVTSYQEIENNSSSINGQNEESFVREYLGDEYSKFYNGGFSIWAFLFSYLYFFYRRVYGFGIFIYIVSITVSFISTSFLKDNLISVIINLVLGLVWGAMFKGVYIDYIKTHQSSLSGKPKTSLIVAIGITFGLGIIATIVKTIVF